MSSNGQVQISDFSDREILSMILDLSAQGDFTALELATRIYGWRQHEITVENKAIDHGARCVCSRLTWMKRFGLIDKGEKPGEWSISEEGKQMIRSHMQENVMLAVKRAPDYRTLDLANLVGERMVSAGQVAGTAMRRELQFQITRRKRA